MDPKTDTQTAIAGVESDFNESKLAIIKLKAELEQTTDPDRRAELSEALYDLAAPFGDYGLTAEDLA